MINAYFFDLDGTVYPRTSVLYRAMSERIRSWFQTQLRIPNEKADAFFADLKVRYPNPLCAIEDFKLDPRSFQNDVFGRLNATKTLHYSGRIRRALRVLKGKKFVITLATRDHALDVLNALGVADLVNGIHPWGESWATTNKYDAYEGIRYQIGLPRESILVVGDSYETDLHHALLAGYSCVLVSPVLSPGVVTIRDIGNLPRLVNKEGSTT